MALVLGGLALGIGAGLPLTNYLGSMLFRVPRATPVIFVAAGALLVLV